MHTVFKAVKLWSPTARFCFDSCLADVVDYQLVSVFAPEEDARVVYVPGEWAVAPGWLAARNYHLTAFAHFHQAREFVRDYGLKNCSVIFDAEAEGVEFNGWLLPPILVAATLSKTCKFVPRHVTYRSRWQDGTMMAERMRLGTCRWSTFNYAPLGISRTS